MSFWGFKPYVSVAQRRAQANEKIVEFKKTGRVLTPVSIEGRKIADSFWGKAWCDNLERYSDYANRLPRGRSYARNGSVIDLQIQRGRVEALVNGSELYTVKIDIAVAAPSRWKSICADCAGSVGSLVELLQGKLSKHVMDRVCREADGLFPAPKEIKLSCSCPDWADMCKHVAAALYGVGARLDRHPDLLFTLRGVDRAELVSNVADLPLTRTAATSDRVLADDDLEALFGLEMGAPTPSVAALETVKSAAAALPHSAANKSAKKKPAGARTAGKAALARGAKIAPAPKVAAKKATPAKTPKPPAARSRKSAERMTPEMLAKINKTLAGWSTNKTDRLSTKTRERRLAAKAAEKSAARNVTGERQK